MVTRFTHSLQDCYPNWYRTHTNTKLFLNMKNNNPAIYLLVLRSFLNFSPIVQIRNTERIRGIDRNSSCFFLFIFLKYVKRLILNVTPVAICQVKSCSCYVWHFYVFCKQFLQLYKQKKVINKSFVCNCSASQIILYFKRTKNLYKKEIFCK